MLLEFAEQYPGMFTRKALAARKASELQDTEQAWTYASDAFEARPGSFKALGAQLTAHSAYYDKNVAPIRHKVFAHAGGLTREERERLFTDIRVRDMESLLVFPLQVHRALWNLYHNGRPPDLPTVDTLLPDILGKGQGATLEHVYAAREMAGFLRRFQLEEQ